MPHTKPITVGIIYRPPNQSKFLDIFEENLPKLNTSYREIYFLGDFNINLFENGKYVFQKSSSNNKNLDSFTKKYHECCTLFGLTQLINCTTRVTWNSSSILDHGVIDIGISDHQLMYCTRKTARIKSYCYKQITFRSLKNYSPEVYEDAIKLRKLGFSNYELMTLTKPMKTSFRRSWQLLIILHPVKTNVLRVHRKIGLMLKSRKKQMTGYLYLLFMWIKITIRKQGIKYKD